MKAHAMCKATVYSACHLSWPDQTWITPTPFLFWGLGAGENPFLSPSVEAGKAVASGILLPSQLNVVSPPTPHFAFWFFFLYVKPARVELNAQCSVPTPHHLSLLPSPGRSQAFSSRQRKFRNCLFIGGKLDLHQFGTEAMQSQSL